MGGERWIEPDCRMWPAHEPRRITISLEKLCPVHRGLIVMSGRVAHIRPVPHPCRFHLRQGWVATNAPASE
jgi:hypothetical protein